MLVDQETGLDVMQVCRNGHVVTDRLRGDPESGRSHCERCGAATIHCCQTCGQPFPGAGHAPGLVPIGAWPPPRYCSRCGAVFPWVRKPLTAPGALQKLEALLHRLPLVIRQLRWRQGDQPPFRVEDERDLEDLLRALLALHFDDIRLENRTPGYSQRTRTDLLLAAEKIALIVKVAHPTQREPELAEQLRQDVVYYRQKEDYSKLVGFVYDPEGLLRDQHLLESAAPEPGDELTLRCIVAAFGGEAAGTENDAVGP